MEDLYEVRCLLELQAVKTSIYRISYEEIDALERQFQEALASCERGENATAGEFSELDWELHTLLVERCTNNYIKSIIASNDSNLRRYQALSIEALNDVQESVEDRGFTYTPIPFRISTKPSLAKKRSASRTGVRLISSHSASCPSLKILPGTSSPLHMASLILLYARLERLILLGNCKSFPQRLQPTPVSGAVHRGAERCSGERTPAFRHSKTPAGAESPRTAT